MHMNEFEDPPHLQLSRIYVRYVHSKRTRELDVGPERFTCESHCESSSTLRLIEVI